jgi:hypothetical protein
MRPPHWDHYKNLAPTPPLSKPLTNSRLITVLPTPAGCFNQNPTIGKNSVGSVGLRYSLTTYGSGFKRASLELARHVYKGWSTNLGREKITAYEKLVEAWPEGKHPIYLETVKRPSSITGTTHITWPFHSRRWISSYIQGQAETRRKNHRRERSFSFVDCL